MKEHAEKYLGKRRNGKSNWMEGGGEEVCIVGEGRQRRNELTNGIGICKREMLGQVEWELEGKFERS